MGEWVREPLCCFDTTQFGGAACDARERPSGVSAPRSSQYTSGLYPYHCSNLDAFRQVFFGGGQGLGPLQSRADQVV